MINEKDICFVTTTLYTKWLNYQSKILKNNFPESNHIIVDGTKTGPTLGFTGLMKLKKPIVNTLYILMKIFS